MSCEIITTPRFEKELKHLSKKYPSFKKDFAGLLEELQTNPRIGEEFKKDCYKIRLAITSKNKGKSGGARVITFFYTVKETLYLLSTYDKSERVSIKDHEVEAILEEIT